MDKPRQFSIVQYKKNIILKEAEFDGWIFFGEIPNMPGFCCLMPLRQLKQPRIVDMDMIEEAPQDDFMKELESQGY